MPRSKQLRPPSPCRGCGDKVSVPIRSYRALLEASTLSKARAAEIADLKLKNAQLARKLEQADKSLALEAAAKDLLVDPDYWRKGNSPEHGYGLIHNPETCDECYGAQMEKDAEGRGVLPEIPDHRRDPVAELEREFGGSNR